MTLKINAKFEEKLICCFKTDENLVSFDLMTQKSQKSSLIITVQKLQWFDWSKGVQLNC